MARGETRDASGPCHQIRGMARVKGHRPCLSLLAGSDGDNDPFQEASLDDWEAGVKSPMGMVLKKAVVT